MSRHRSRNQGFSLVELAIVMGVMGTIMGAIWYAASNAQESNRSVDAFNELQIIVHNVDDLLAGRPLPVSGTYTTSLIASGAIPASYTSSSTVADSPWGQNDLVVYANPAGTNNRLFRVSFYNITAKGCASLIQAATNCGPGLGCPVTVSVKAGGPSVGMGANGWVGVMTSSEAAYLCGLNSYPPPIGNNSLEFDYLL